MIINVDEDTNVIEVGHFVQLTNGNHQHILVQPGKMKFSINNIESINAKIRNPNRRERLMMVLHILPRMNHVLIPDNSPEYGIKYNGKNNNDKTTGYL